MKNRWPLVVVAALLLPALTAACKQHAGSHNQNSHNENTHNQNTQSAGNTHLGVGVVESIDRDLATVQIDHEEIKDFMPAMNMPFRVKDKTLLDAANPGDRVEFTIEDTSDGMFLVAIKKL